MEGSVRCCSQLSVNITACSYLQLPAAMGICFIPRITVTHDESEEGFVMMGIITVSDGDKRDSLKKDLL